MGKRLRALASTSFAETQMRNKCTFSARKKHAQLRAAVHDTKNIDFEMNISVVVQYS